MSQSHLPIVGSVEIQPIYVEENTHEILPSPAGWLVLREPVHAGVSFPTRGCERQQRLSAGIQIAEQPAFDRFAGCASDSRGQASGFQPRDELVGQPESHLHADSLRVAE